MKNLVLGLAKGYGWYILEPLVNSFKKNCPSAELVLFVDDVSDFTRDRLRRQVKIFDIPAEYKDIMPIHVRWKMYADFLERFGDEYEQVFITDTRDVIFQADLFDRFKGFSNWLGCVTEGEYIGGKETGDNANYNWLVGFFGKDAADKLVDRKVICCGTVIGSVTEMKILCRIMWEVLKTETVWGYEQGAMNYLAYNNPMAIENLFEIDVDDGEIFTISLLSLHKAIGIRNGMILRGNLGVPAVVHQYDRVGDLIKLVDELYHDKNFSFDPRFNDTRSLLEQCCGLLLVDKTDDAAWLFLKVFFAAEDLTNYVNLLMELWKIALRKPFTRSIEILELAVQNALLPVDMEKLSVNQLRDVKNFFVEANKSNHAVDLKLKFSFANRLLRIVKHTLELNAANECFFCINWINQLELPPDENFQRVVAEAERTFGRRR